MKPTPAAEKGVASILLVDDHPGSLLALRAVLSPLGQNLVEASSGEEALERTLAEEFAVIFMDVRMSGLSGIKTAALIGERPHRRKTPVILLTGLDSDEKQIIDAYAHGVVDYLRKPYQPTVLRAKASMFVELYLAQEEVKRQGALLRDKDRELLEAAHREQLEESEARFRTLADTIPQLTWMAEPDGSLFWYNQRWYEFTATSFEQMRGWGWRSVIDPAWLGPVSERWSAALSGGEPFEMEYPIRRGDGVYRWHLTRAVPLRDGTGRISRWFGTNTDVDDQRRAGELQHLLAEASKQLSASLEAEDSLRSVAALAVPTFADWCAIDLLEEGAPLETRRVAVAHVSPERVALARTLRERYPEPRESGHGVLHVLRTGAADWVPEIDDAQLVAAAKDDEHLRILRELGLKSSLVLPLLVRDRPLGTITLVQAESGRRFGEQDLRMAEELASRVALALENARLFEQVTQLNASLEARVQARTAELQDVNRELESFSYSVSHDLRAPLRHITGFAQLLERRMGAQLDETSRGFLRTISEAAQQGGKLVDDLLAFSRLGRAAMRHSRVDLHELIRDVQRELAPELEGRTVIWKVGELPSVQADAGLLRMALRNLLSNALKYTRPVPEAVVEIEAQKLADETQISIRDNGVGFDMAYVDKLFGVFQRLHTAEEFEGTGIGLANVRRIVTRHGGRAWAEGEQGRGATFYLTLPNEPPPH